MGLDGRQLRRRHGEAGQPVLYDLVLGRHRAELPSQLGQLLHGEPAILGEEHRADPLQTGLEVLDRGDFFLRRHALAPRPGYFLNWLLMRCASTSIPGPIVVETTSARRYVPLEAEGLARMIDSMTVMALATSWSVWNDRFPTETCTLPTLSTRYSTLPALASRTARLTSKVTVPSLGFGMSPRGPSTLPRRPT